MEDCFETLDDELLVLEQLVDELVSMRPRNQIIKQLFSKIGMEPPASSDEQISVVFDRIQSIQSSFAQLKTKPTRVRQPEPSL